MIADIHAAIRAFLQQHPQFAEPVEKELFTKSGVVPFIHGTPYRYLMMKPQGRVPGLGEPAFQICKGTRMYDGGPVGWRDLRHGQDHPNKESLVETALREGIEELGLKLSNIARLIDVGPYVFSSATTGKGKQMWLFAAEVKSEDDFLHEREVALTTAGRQWLTLPEFEVEGRPDHAYILGQIEKKLLS